MKSDEQMNPRAHHMNEALDEPLCSELDVPGVTAWFDETDRALGDCLTRIEHIGPDVVPHDALRGELLFLLRAARADLVTRYLEATRSVDSEFLPDERGSTVMS